MSMFVMRKLRAKFAGNEDYRPKNFEGDKFVPVVGFECRRVTKNINGEERSIEELFLMLIDDSGKIITTAAFNWRVIIDSSDDNLDKTVTLLNGAISMVKKMSEKQNESA